MIRSHYQIVISNPGNFEASKKANMFQGTRRAIVADKADGMLTNGGFGSGVELLNLFGW